MSAVKKTPRQTSLEDLGTLSAELLHELKQPLFAVKGTAQLMRTSCEGRDAERLLQILEQVSYMEALVEHYGSFGQASGAEHVFDLDEPVGMALGMLVEPARRAQVQLDIALHGGGMPCRGREHAIRQVTVNLVKNALDAVRGREGARIAVRTRPDGDHVLLEVEDSGAGVPEDLRDAVFQPFVTSKPPGDGMGLGLHIVWKLVEEARGTLAMDATEAGGTLVTVRLPRER